MGEMVLRNAWWPTLDALDCVPLQWRVRYDKTTDAISDRSAHKYGGYLTPLLPIAAASPDCQPRPLATPQKPTLLFPATNPPFKIQMGFHANHPPKPTLLFPAHHCNSKYTGEGAFTTQISRQIKTNSRPARISLWTSIGSVHLIS